LTSKICSIFMAVAGLEWSYNGVVGRRIRLPSDYNIVFTILPRQ